MTQESKQADEMRWDEHLRAGMHGLKDELRQDWGARGGLKEFRRHGRLALKEMLLAWRSLIDGVISRIEESDKSAGQRASKINIE